MPSIGITLTKQTYNPEAYAYKAYLEKKSWNVQLDFRENLSLNNDITIVFMGLDPIWNGSSFKNIIHNYSSSSTGYFPKIKNSIKKYVNKKPSGRFFLSSFVKQEFNFQDGIESINVGIGIDNVFFEKDAEGKEYDLVYSGAISGRNGLSLELQKISDLDLNILVIGEASESFRADFSSDKNITFLGRVNRDKLPKLYRSAKAGLNFIPSGSDTYRFQPSIKVFEYLATGIGLVTNHNVWTDQFVSKHNYSPLWLENLKTKDDFDSFEFSELDMSQYQWDVILKEVKFEEFLKSRLDTTKG